MTAEWETIWRGPDGSSTSRMIVPDGWIVRHVEAPSGDAEHGERVYTVALTFVADLARAWVIDP